MNSMCKSILIRSVPFIPFCFKSTQKNSYDTDFKCFTFANSFFVPSADCSSRDQRRSGGFHSDSQLKISNYTFPTAVTCDSYIKMTSSTVKGSLTADNFIKLRDSTAGSIKSGSYAEIIDSTTSGIKADSFVQGSNAQVNGAITSGSYVVLNKKSNSQSIHADSYVKVFGSTVKGHILSQSYVSLQDAPEVGSVKANGVLTIKNSKILGDAETSTQIDECDSSMVGGALKCHNLSLEISRSQIKEIIIKAPVFSTSATMNITSKVTGLFVKSSTSSNSTTLAASLKELRDSGQIELQPNRIIIGKTTYQQLFGSNCRSISRLSSITIESYSNSGSSMSTSRTGNSIEIQVGDFHLSARDEQEISEAIQLVLNNASLPTSEQKTSPRPQTITLLDSHVESITFEKPGGIVKLMGSSSAKKINGGTIEKPE